MSYRLSLVYSMHVDWACHRLGHSRMGRWEKRKKLGLHKTKTRGTKKSTSSCLSYHLGDAGRLTCEIFIPLISRFYFKFQDAYNFNTQVILYYTELLPPCNMPGGVGKRYKNTLQSIF